MLVRADGSSDTGEDGLLYLLSDCSSTPMPASQDCVCGRAAAVVGLVSGKCTSYWLLFVIKNLLMTAILLRKSVVTKKKMSQAE